MSTAVYGLFYSLVYTVAVPRKEPMPPHERAICRRLREFRLKTGLSQTQFAVLAGINPRAYAGFEYARTQLNYRAAQRILKFFWTLNPLWLVEGEGGMVGSRAFTFPTAEELGVGLRSLFSKVFQGRLRSEFLAARTLRVVHPGLPVRLFTYDDSPQGRLMNRDRFGQLIREWLAEFPDEAAARFLDELFLRGASLFARYPRETDKSAIAKRKEAMYRIEAARQSLSDSHSTPGLVLVPLENWHKRNKLTDAESHAKDVPVKVQLPNLLERLNRATEKSGKMSALADFLTKATRTRVPLASVSRWLSGKREPGGEITLLLERWVKSQEERQK